MRAKVARVIRKNSYPNGFNRNVEYKESPGGTKIAQGERRMYQDLKKLYKELQSHGL